MKLTSDHDTVNATLVLTLFHQISMYVGLITEYYGLAIAGLCLSLIFHLMGRNISASYVRIQKKFEQMGES